MVVDSATGAQMVLLVEELSLVCECFLQIFCRILQILDPIWININILNNRFEALLLESMLGRSS